MPTLSIACIAAVVAWVILVLCAQRLNPDQSALSMGMSGLARGRAPWVMKAAFAARGVAALALVAALPGQVPLRPLVVVGLVFFWVWGAGSALLALADTDMPGEKPTREGAMHVYIALLAYVAGVAGMVCLSLGLRGEEATAGVARWALPIALVAAVAMIVQLAAFASAADAAPTDAEAPPGEPAVGNGATAQPLAPFAQPLEPAAASTQSRAVMPHGLGHYAGLLQRVFIVLIMAWTVLVAAAI
jgi:hypothetical protein